MGMVDRQIKTELFCKKGHFLIKDDKGKFVITNTTSNTTTNYIASNGFDCYLDNISLFSSTKEELIQGTTDEFQTIETRIWTLDLHDEEGDYYEMKFYVGKDRSSSTFFGLINSLANIQDFGMLKLTANSSDYKVNGKDDIQFTHIKVVNFVNGMPFPVYHKFNQDEIPPFEIAREASGKAIIKPGGYTAKDYSKKLQFFENLIPGIISNIGRSKYPAAQLSSGKVAPALTEYVEDYSEAGDDMDQELPEVPVKAKPVKVAQKDSLYPHVNDDGEVDDVPF